MNSDEIQVESPTSPSNPSSSGRRIRVRVRTAKKASISQIQGVNLPSIPSDDNDWVSPFTLPPLPAIKKPRTQVERSPDDKHSRSGSSAYYAAAWGSPYATPSPSHTPAPKLRNKSFDLESSPLATRKSVDRQHFRQNSLPTRDVIQRNRSTPSPVDSEGKSQRRNWLSESEDSESEEEKDFGKTPTQRKLLGEEPPSSVRSHQFQESVDTITPETFNGTSSLKVKMSQSSPSKMADTQIASSPVEDKPLPNLPASPPGENQESQARPAPLIQSQSFLRRKKVPWNGRTCIIAMPMEDRESAGLPPVLSAEQRQALLQRWIDLGYSVDGFSIGDWSDGNSSSRPTFPDAADLEMDRKNNRPSVHVPDQAEWDAWVSYLKEEKLRALGVTPSTSEAPPSTMSPFSSTISRVSSAFPSNAAPSPPIPTRSVGGHRVQMSVSPFTPHMMQTGGYPGIPQRGTPGIPNGRPGHSYAQSVAFPGMGQRMGSPFAQIDPNMQQNGYFANVRSPDGMTNGRKPWSPGHVQNMQSMAHLMSPGIPSPHEFPRQFSPHTQHVQIQAIQAQQEAIARQQQQVQARMAHARQMSMFPFRTVSTEQLQQIPETPKAVSPVRDPPEIMQPTPRSHRHNLSAALEKGVTDTVAASAKQLSNVVEGDKENSTLAQEEDVEEGEIADHNENDELPILHRPETLKDITDDKADIETNPSIAGTPLLLEEQNPFSNFQPLQPAETKEKRPVFGHAAKPSLSKFNVAAKEFNPSKPVMSPTAGVFNFDGNAFGSQISSPTKSVADGPRFGHKHNPSSLGLNVAAPAFTPSFAAKPDNTEILPVSASEADHNAVKGFGSHLKNNSIPEETIEAIQTFHPEASTFSFGAQEEVQQGTPAKSTFDPRSSTFSFTGQETSQYNTPLKSDFDPNASTFSTFSFGSTNLNVEAPEFKPSGMFSSTNFTPEKPAAYSGTMFGDVVIDPANKPERRTKAVTIVKPQSREGSAAPEDEKSDEVDAQGRLVAPSERHKRAKTGGLDNEDVLFASSAPFSSLAEEKPLESHTEMTEAPEVADESETTKRQAEADTMPEVEQLQPDIDLKITDDKNESIDETRTVADVSRPEETEILATNDNVLKDDIERGETAELVPESLQSNNVRSREVSPVSSRDDLGEDGEPGPALEDSDVEAGDDTEYLPRAGDRSNTEFMESANTKSAPFSADAAPFEPKKTVLSANASPFEFSPKTPEIPKVKKGGLMASRFAESSPPERPVMVERNSSPPQQLFGEVDKDGSQSISPIRNSKHLEPSKEAARTLERFREADPGASDHGDMSLDEINAVMRQFEEDPDLGVIREETPVKPTPLIDIRFPRQQFRSDAPSPSPRRLDKPFDPQQHGEKLSGLGFDVSSIHQLNYIGGGEVSDWNEELSPGQQDKLESRAQFFDDHVNDIVDNVLENRLAPLERALESIAISMQNSVSRSSRPRRSMSTDNKHSDADDEDDPLEQSEFSKYRSRSPGKSQRQQERIKAAVMEAMTVAQSTLPSTQIDTSAIQEMLSEVRAISQHSQKTPQIDASTLQETLEGVRALSHNQTQRAQDTELAQVLAELKAMAAEKAATTVVPPVDLSAVLSSLAEIKAVNEKFTEAQISRSGQETEDKQKLEQKVRELEALLLSTEKRADQEAALRREGEELNEELSTKLQKVGEQSNGYKAFSEKVQQQLNTVLEAQNGQSGDSDEMHDLRLKIKAQTETLDEYRSLKSQLTQELTNERARSAQLAGDLSDAEDKHYSALEKERAKSEKLASALSDARRLHNDQLETRNALRDQLAKVQERITATTESFHLEQAEWRQREYDVLSKNELLKQSLDYEISRRLQLELAVDATSKDKEDGILFRAKHEAAQEEVARLANIIVGLQKDVSIHQANSASAQRDLEQLTNNLEASAEEIQTIKSTHQANLQKMFENHKNSVREAEGRHAADLEQRLAIHEEKLIDLKEKHERDMSNAKEDREALRHRHEEKLSLSDDKVKHLESRIEDLKHSLEITQKAARAAADSAISKGINLPTPASSVIASPPHRASVSSASMAIQRGTDLPEKISPQALRESILVLQDQLQSREAEIDELKAELGAIDKEAPNKVKDRDTEIVMLRELFDVRIDDLQEIIGQLEKPDYNRQAIKDAAIRLKTQIKMEQQLRERAITATNNPHTVASGISNITASPRSMVAAAAWSNWRKIRDSSIGNAAVSLASDIASTPTRSNSASRLSQTRTPENSRQPPSRPLANASARKAAPPAGGARPLRTINTQPRTMSGARPLARRGTSESRPSSSGSTIIASRLEPPSTPIQATMENDFGDDVDEDASPLDGKDRGFDSELDNQPEPEPAPKPVRVVSPRTSRTSISKQPASPTTSRTSFSKGVASPKTTRTSRHSSSKPMSPRSLRQSAGASNNDVVEVFEED